MGKLEVYAKLRLREKYTPEAVTKVIEDLQLRGFQNKKAGHLSVGNQRKLAFAISIQSFATFTKLCK